MVFTEGTDVLKRLLAATAIAACIAGAAACGSGDDGDDGSEADAKADNTAQVSGTSEQQISATYKRFLDALADKDADGACATMTDRARKGFSSYELGGKSCEKSLLLLIGDSVQGDNRPRIIGVKIDGSKALARVRTGTGQTVSGVRFAKQKGEWKINGTAIAD
jgi:hypothetical protein